MIGTLLRRDLGLLLPGGRGGGGVLPLLFFLAVAMLYPFAVGPDAQLLARTGGGVIWVAALLAAILPLEKLVAADLEAGVFDQLYLRGVSEEWAMTSRLLAHWLAFAPLLLLATLPAAALLGISEATTRIVLLGLLAGTPGLAAVGLAVAALTASLRGGQRREQQER
ncbi:heme ABC transporter permease CcmB, partial [Erythrobacter sp. HI0037]